MDAVRFCWKIKSEVIDDDDDVAYVVIILASELDRDLQTKLMMREGKKKENVSDFTTF